MKTWIPDVSEHQGKISWDKLKDIPGAIIRVGYGDDLKNQDDVYALYNMKECTRLGIPFAVYLYSYAKTETQIKSEIAHVQRMCKGFSPVFYWYDLEERSASGIWGKAAEMWQAAFGEKSGVYSWQWAFEKHVDSDHRWVCAYGTNDGTRQDEYKPTIGMDMWQFTSRGRLSGINGYVDMNEVYVGFGEPVKIEPTRRIVTKKEVAAIIMRHLCTHKGHGYTQDMTDRQGTGTEEIDVYGKKYTIKGGDRDCSSAVISAYEAAGISCGGATYTGNMRKCMTGTGNFAWKPMTYIAQMGDSYLNEKYHTAMCMSAEPDILAEFSINEKGEVLGGEIGDQKQVGEYDETLGRGESHLAEYYDYPWDGILRCINEEIAFCVEPDGTITTDEREDGFTAGGEAPQPTNTDLAIEVIFGVHGSGDARRKALGDKWSAVQSEVNRLWKSNDLRTAAEKAYFKRFGHKNLI